MSGDDDMILVNEGADPKAPFLSSSSQTRARQGRDSVRTAAGAVDGGQGAIALSPALTGARQ